MIVQDWMSKANMSGCNDEAKILISKFLRTDW